MGQSIRESLRALLIGIAVVLSMFGKPALAEGTPVERGDILFVSVVGIPEIDREARVDVDGRVTLPLIGPIDVAGTDLVTIRRRIEQVLISEEILLKPSVLVEVASYRPIYVGGDVRRSGSIPYEPGLTVRHALIAAGGRARIEGPGPTLGEVLELLARQRATTLALAQIDSEIARHQAQLDTDGAGMSLDREVLTDVDRALLHDLREQQKADLDHAETAVALVETEIDVLNRQAAHQQAEHELQSAEIERTRDLVDRGLVASPKLTELQREGSRLSRDILENHAFSARAEQARVNIWHRTQATLSERRIATRQAYRAALERRADLEAERDILAGHLLAAGPAVTSAQEDVEAQIVLFRVSDGVTQEISVAPETLLKPGDIVEFRLPRLPRG